MRRQFFARRGTSFSFVGTAKRQHSLTTRTIAVSTSARNLFPSRGPINAPVSSLLETSRVNLFQKRPLVSLPPSSVASPSDRKSDTRPDGFIANAFPNTAWRHIYNDLMTQGEGRGNTPSAQLTPIQWRQAVELLHALRLLVGSPSHDDDDNNATTIDRHRLKYMFRLLTRLGTDLELQRGSNVVSPSNTIIPGLDQGSIVAVLVAWRDHHNFDGGTSRLDLHQFPEDELGPAALLRSLQYYVKVGLVPPSPAYFNVILHVLKWYLQDENHKNSFAVAEWAHEEIWQNSMRTSHTTWSETKGTQDVDRKKGKENSGISHPSHPDAATVYGMVELWAFSGQPQRASQYILALEQWNEQWQIIHKRHHHNPFQLSPNLYCGLIEAYSRSKEGHSPQEALQEIQRIWHSNILPLLLQSLQSSQDGAKASTGGNTNVNHIYNRSCHAMLTCGGFDEAQELLYHATEHFSPDTILFTTLISAFGRAGRPQEAHTIFSMMQQKTGTTPSALAFAELIWAIAREGDSCQQVPSIMQQMIQAMEEEEEQQEEERNDTDKYESKQHDWAHAWDGVLVSWANNARQNPEAPGLIREIIEKLKEMDRRSQGRGRPPLVTPYSYNILLSSYAQQGTIESAKAAEDLFTWMKQQEEKDARPLKEKIDHNPIILDRTTYLNVITAWCNAGKPEHAQSLLLRFSRELNSGSSGSDSFSCPRSLLDAQHFAVVLEAWVKSSNPRATKQASKLFALMNDVNIAPNVVCYTSLLWVWTRSTDQTVDPAKPIVDLFEEMHEQWLGTGNEDCKPNHITYNALLSGLSRSSDPAALDRASHYFEQMQHLHNLKPSVFLYNTLMAAWSKKNRPNRAQALFREMKQAYEDTGDPNLKPNEVVYRTILLAWSKAGNPDRAASALQEWIEASQSGQITKAPTEREFASVLQAWIRSRKAQAPDRAEQGLRQMIELAQAGNFDCLPTVFTVTSVITAYAKAASTRPDAGERAWSLFVLLEELGQIDETMKRGKLPKTRKRNGDEFAPNLITCFQVVTALVVAPTSDSEVLIRQVLDRLRSLMHPKASRQHVKSSFRTELRSGELLEKLKSVIASSTLGNRDELIGLCHELQDMVMQIKSR